MRSLIGAAVAATTAAALAGCALFPDRVDENREARRIVEAYRVDAMLAQSAPIITDAVMANLPAGPGEDERERLRAAIHAAYDAERLEAAVADRLAEWARVQDRADALRHAADRLNSELARDMIAREDAAADDQFAQGFQTFLQQPANDASDQAVRRMRGLADDLRLVELQTAFNLGMMQGMIAARNTVVSDDYSISPTSERMMLEETRAGLDMRLSQQIPVMLLYAYRDVDQARRAAYAELQHDEALRWVNRALAEALETALADAAERVSDLYQPPGA